MKRHRSLAVELARERKKCSRKCRQTFCVCGVDSFQKIERENDVEFWFRNSGETKTKLNFKPKSDRSRPKRGLKVELETQNLFFSVRGA